MNLSNKRIVKCQKYQLFNEHTKDVDMEDSEDWMDLWKHLMF